MSWDDSDFFSSDPLTRYNAHQAAKGRSQMPDPDEVRKRQKETALDRELIKNNPSIPEADKPNHTYKTESQDEN